MFWTLEFPSHAPAPSVIHARIHKKSMAYAAHWLGVQLILGFGLLGRRRNQSNKNTARKAGSVVKSSCTSTFLSRVHWTGCRLEMVEFTALENLKIQEKKYNESGGPILVADITMFCFLSRTTWTINHD